MLNKNTNINSIIIILVVYTSLSDKFLNLFTIQYLNNLKLIASLSEKLTQYLNIIDVQSESA